MRDCSTESAAVSRWISANWRSEIGRKSTAWILSVPSSAGEQAVVGRQARDKVSARKISGCSGYQQHIPAIVEATFAGV